MTTQHKGWKYDAANDRLAAQFDGTEVFDFDANDMVITPATTVTGALTTAAGVTSTSATAGIGYATGAGGAVTQITSASTGVELNKVCGQITTVALTTAAAAEERFTVTNSTVDANDVVALSTTYNGAGTPMLSVLKVAAGAFDVVLTNVHAANALDAVIVINFVVLKSVAA